MLSFFFNAMSTLCRLSHHFHSPSSWPGSPKLNQLLSCNEAKTFTGRICFQTLRGRDDAVMSWYVMIYWYILPDFVMLLWCFTVPPFIIFLFLEKLCRSNSWHLPGHPSAEHFPPCRAARRGPATPRTSCSVAAVEPWRCKEIKSNSVSSLVMNSEELNPL